MKIIRNVKVKVKVRSVHTPKLETELELLVDTSATYTIIQCKNLQTLNTKPTGKRRFKTADGRIIGKVSLAEIEIKGQTRTQS